MTLSIAFRLIRSAVLLWIVLRVVAWVLGLPPTSRVSLLLIPPLVVGLAGWELRRKDEWILFQNLAVRPLLVWSVFLATAVVLDTGLRLAVRAFLTAPGGPR